MGLGHVTVHIEVPRSLRYPNFHPVHFLRQLHLAPQSACRFQPIRQIQHVLLVLTWIWEGVVHGVCEYSVAGRAGADALAGALELNLVGVSYLEEGLTDVCGDWSCLAVVVKPVYGYF